MSYYCFAITTPLDSTYHLLPKIRSSKCSKCSLKVISLLHKLQLPFKVVISKWMESLNFTYNLLPKVSVLNIPNIYFWGVIIYHFIYLFNLLSIHTYISPSICYFFYLFINISIYLSVYLSFYQPYHFIYC